MNQLLLRAWWISLLALAAVFLLSCSTEPKSKTTEYLQIDQFYQKPERWLSKPVTLIGFQESAHLKDGKYIVLHDLKGKRRIQVYKGDDMPLFNTLAFGQTYAITGEIEITSITPLSIEEEQNRLMSILCQPEWDSKRCYDYFKRTSGYQNLMRKRQYLKRTKRNEVKQYALVASAIEAIEVNAVELQQ